MDEIRTIDGVSYHWWDERPDVIPGYAIYSQCGVDHIGLARSLSSDICIDCSFVTLTDALTWVRQNYSAQNAARFLVDTDCRVN